MFWIRYQTATHMGLHGPFRSLQGARRALRKDFNWYHGMLASTVQADSAGEAEEAEVIDFVTDLRDLGEGK